MAVLPCGKLCSERRLRETKATRAVRGKLESRKQKLSQKDNKYVEKKRQ